MLKITKYKVLQSQGPDSLATYVNADLKDGWQPYGCMKALDGCFLQPMVQEEREVRRTSPTSATDTCTATEAAPKSPSDYGYASSGGCAEATVSVPIKNAADDLQTENMRLRGVVNELHSLLHDAKVEIGSLQDCNERQADRLRQPGARADHYEKVAQSMVNKLEASRQTANVFADQRDAAVKERDLANNAKAEFEKLWSNRGLRLGEANSQIEALTQQRADYQDQIIQACAQRDEANATIEALRTRRSEYTETMRASYQEKLIKAEAEIKELRDMLGRAVKLTAPIYMIPAQMIPSREP